jgi:hypothetical protein
MLGGIHRVDSLQQFGDHGFKFAVTHAAGVIDDEHDAAGLGLRAEERDAGGGVFRTDVAEAVGVVAEERPERAGVGGEQAVGGNVGQVRFTSKIAEGGDAGIFDFAGGLGLEGC